MHGKSRYTRVGSRISGFLMGSWRMRRRLDCTLKFQNTVNADISHSWLLADNPFRLGKLVLQKRNGGARFSIIHHAHFIAELTLAARLGPPGRGRPL